MIEIVQGDIFANAAQALVNPVNCVGVMGAGLAKQFKEKFPDNFDYYRGACGSGLVFPGKMTVFHYGTLEYTNFIVNFPTKLHWRDASRMEYIESGLADLARIIEFYNITSIAIPALGCGLGGLKWPQVKATIYAAMDGLPNVRILIYPPKGS